MHPLFAELASPASTSWIAISALGAVLVVALNFLAIIRIANGKANERQIEPTQLAALQAEMRTNFLSNQSELRSQTATLNKLDREMGGICASVSAMQRDITEVKVGHTQSIEGVHARMGGISRELASTTARVDGLENRETHHT